MEIESQGKGPEIYSKLKSRFDSYIKEGHLKQVKDLKYDDASCSAVASGAGFKATIKCRDGKVVVDLDLGLLLKPLRGQIEDGIRKSLTRAMS